MLQYYDADADAYALLLWSDCCQGCAALRCLICVLRNWTSASGTRFGISQHMGALAANERDYHMPNRKPADGTVHEQYRYL